MPVIMTVEPHDIKADSRPGISSPLRISSIFLGFGMLWIWLSDGGMLWNGDLNLFGYLIAAGKGTLFVVLSAGMVYVLVRRDFRLLQNSNLLLNAVVNGTTDAVFVKSSDGTYLLFNEAASRFVGKPIGEVLGRDDFELFDHESAQRIVQRDRDVIASGRIVTEEETLTATGSTRTYLSTKGPFRDGNGKISGTIGIARDITAWKQTEAEFRLSEQRFRQLADAIPQIVWTASPDGGLTHLNAKTTEYTGVSTDKLTGWSWDQVIHPEDLPKTIGIWTEVLQTGIPSDMEFRIRRQDGEYRWHMTRQVPTRNLSGQVTNWYGTCTDIEDIRRTEVALRESESRFRGAFEDTNVAMAITDLEYHIIRVNNAFAGLFGFRQEDMLRQSLAIVTFPDDVPENDDRRKPLLEGTLNHIEIEKRYRHRDGRVIWGQTNIALVRGSDGVPLYYVGQVQDITIRKQAERAMAERARASAMRASVAIAVARPGDVRLILQECCEILIRDLDAALARVWKLEPARNELELQSSAGLATHVNGGHSRIPIGKFKIGQIGAERKPHLTNSVAGDPRIPDQDWVTREGLKSFAGYPLLVEDRLVGVVALFARSTLSDHTFAELSSVADLLAQCIERKRAEAELDRQQNELQLILDAVPAMIFYKDLDHRLVRVNREMVRLTGLSQSQIIGKTDAELGSPYADQYVADEIEVIATGQPKRGILESTMSSFGQRQLLTDKFPHRDETGRIVGIVGFSLDITERMKSEAALKKLGQLIQHSRDIISLADLEGRITFLNAGGRKMLGIGEQDDVTGIPLSDNLPPDWQNFFRDTVLPAAREHGLWEGEMQMMHRQTGERIDVVRTTFLIRDTNGNPDGYATVSRDITARKQAELAFRDRERLLRIVTGSARVGLVVIGERYEHLFANEAYREIFHLPKSEILGRNVADVLPDAWPEIQPRLDRALAGEQIAFELVLEIPSEPVELHWFRVMYEPHRDESGQPTVVVVILDVTDQKRTEAQIRDNEERYRRLVDVLPAAVFTHNGKQVLYCNPAYVRLMGAGAPGDLIGKNPFDFVHPDFHEVVRNRIWLMDQTGQTQNGIEIQIIRLDGRVVTVYSVATPLSDHGRPISLIVLTDLTERERSGELLRSVLGSVGDAIVTIDPQGRIGSVNPSTRHIFGYSENELVGNNICMLMPEPHHSRHDTYISDFLRTGNAKVIGIGRELEALRKDGQRFPIELTVTAFQMDGERHFTGVVRDITARKSLEAQFQQSQKMEAVGRLAGGVAHDFNNLLTVINGYGDLLLMELPAEDPKRESVAAIRDAGDRAARLTQQLLAFSRKAIVAPKILDLNELVSESANLLRRLIGEDINLTVIADPMLPRIKVDPGQLEQVIMNLAVNARDAMPTGGRLTIETRVATVKPEEIRHDHDLTPGLFARMNVTDTGQGMTPDVREKIFEPFFTTKGVGKGSGLGLAVVHGVMKQSGGHISLESQVGVGTTFTLLFPAADDVTHGTKSGSSRSPTKGTETILIVEDEEAVRRIARISLETQGYLVLEASGGRAALQVAEHHDGTIHLLLSDVVMPEMSGRQLVERIRKQRPDMKVLYMSGYTDDAIVLHGVVEKADAFLQKPFTPLGLAQRVRALLDGKKS